MHSDLSLWQFRNRSNCFFFIFQNFGFQNWDVIWICQCLKTCVDLYCKLPLRGMCLLPVKRLWWKNNLSHMLVCIHLLPVFVWSNLVREGGISIRSGKGCLWSSIVSRHAFHGFEMQTWDGVFSGNSVSTYSLLKRMQLKSCVHKAVFLIKHVDRFSWGRCYSRNSTLL